MKVVIAGANGFVGKAVISRLSQDPSIKVRALARTLTSTATENLETRSCDLFSLLDVERDLAEQEQAIYLVHSMLPSSQLSQGNFADYDLILADNFARAAKKNGIKRILYLGGIVPYTSCEREQDLSLHLRSRLEVEQIFKSYNIPLLGLRAGMVMGAEGSSFQILLRLINRLPMMICPAWTQNPTSPIHVRDVAESFYFALQNQDLVGSFDLSGPQSITYLQMLKAGAKQTNKRRYFLDVPFFSPKLSKLWVRTITGAPKNLVYPLVDSLKHNMSPNPDKTLLIPNHKYISFDEALEETLHLAADTMPTPKAYTMNVPTNRLRVVQSVQRHLLPNGKSVEWASKKYVEWLNQNFRGVISVKTEGNITTFCLLKSDWKLLELTMSKDRSSEDRILFYITGGMLAKSNKRGRLEFRSTPDKKFLITAIHDYKPKLPWYIYRYSQAFFHSSVMRRFGESLSSSEE